MTADPSWAAVRELAASWPAGRAVDVPVHEAIGAVPTDDVLAPRPIPHYDSSAMDGWAVAGPPPGGSPRRTSSCPARRTPW
ncbi:hypothetical protein [Amnibacterium kyonggiense]